MILAFFVGNDFDEKESAIESRREEGAARWSLLARLARNLHRLYGARDRDGGDPVMIQGDGVYPTGGYPLPFPDYDPMKPTFPEDRFLRIQGRRLRLVLRSEREAFEEKLALVAAGLERFNQQVRRTGAAFFVVLIPDEFQVDEEHRARLLAASGLTAADVDVDLPQRRLGEIFARSGIPYLDLLPVFRRQSRSERLYKLQDTHWNVAGNTLAAEELAAALKARLRLGRS